MKPKKRKWKWVLQIQDPQSKRWRESFWNDRFPFLLKVRQASFDPQYRLKKVSIK